jgi:hypothetical protein
MSIDLACVTTAIGALVALTNVVVQVLKKATWDKLPTNLVAIIVAVILSVAAGIAYCQIRGVPMTWYILAGLLVGGFLVAYAAMFGFDKLKEIMDWSDRDE